MADDSNEAPESGAKHPGGRPTKYDPAFAKQAAKLCKLGATDAELADFFEVSIRTVERWRGEHPEFCRAVKVAKAVADQRVERSLYQRAIGYSHDAVKITQNGGDVITKEYREIYPPDTAACIFWLKNRDKDRWRDKQEVEHGVTGEVAESR
ncbi:hypothetical protein GCM10007874_29110 [Labrys miyagiensis]|uniref:Terminase n=1 Tax=Labrys miyagiensis TaxID=346912 RepID=A0ABQ6CJH8_9HYPH|nr:helix-turn-helix domain-containing protein [Labrys miyagiensis]GLS19894.1 hypothetical protein GCM10007874_29110 [Labrys miyagiensis]